MNEKSHMEIENSVALVTGGNRGIGEAFVRAFVAAGARRVYVGSRVRDAAAHLVAEAPDRVVAIQLDVTDPQSVLRAAKDCPDVTILVNNAGQFHQQTLLRAPDLSSARDEMEVNYFGTLAMCRAFAPVLARSPSSAIANVLSAAGVVAVPVMGGYSPSKFATRALSTCLRAELAPQGTSVTALFVGSVDTRMAAHVKGTKEMPETIAAAGLAALRRGVPEADTDRRAIERRAMTIREPETLARQNREQLTATEIHTGR
jgi:NAD(P)-dependent dehydrogenase (short-subunit alcohol dehydrogenase family)